MLYERVLKTAMKILGRSPERYLLGLKRISSFLAASWRAVLVFEAPLTVIWSYIARRPPAEGVVRLRGGRVVHMSGDPADIVTVFLIFAREDYGKISAGSDVVDIGANIGAFALYAAFSGAKRVHAFEPSGSSYEVLLKNIRANGLDSVIRAERQAVVGRASGPVKFPRASDVMNAILPESSESRDFDLVPATTLAEIVSSLKEVDILKSDCEGAEYGIFLQAAESDIRKLAEIRMEIHQGPKEDLLARLTRFGYDVRQFMGEDGGSGYLWLKRR